MSAPTWDAMPLNVLDFESTGVDALNDRAVQAALVEFRPGRRPVARTWLVDPGIEIPDGAANIHGLTTAHVREHATHTPDQMLFELTGLIAYGLTKDIPLAAFNAAYDLTLLECENVRHGIDTVRSRMRRGSICPVVDPHVLDKKFSRRKGSRKLVDVCAFYGVVHTGAHDAAGDAIATGRLIPRIMASEGAKKAKVQHYSPVILHQAQIEWRTEQMDNLRKYFDGKKIEHDGCDPGWPIQRRAVDVLSPARGAA
ncbi:MULTISPECIES: exonuclease domain-containing protein [unclassified Nocardioides]|uniref:exonuclease domain-containing protein n=1 Tax=unclassified Nocardioides TaxID=2615069 RepID=UPI0009F06351|nr:MULTISPECIES: exonuclease domain-containing protein [unclassified Nocardioides]GAW50584.1 DNA polymerase III subunit epsilon [Nocardioides sp. PD653-B2]GAW57469.1 DNA polymerase III subunit epsilon [Nocardioides sp. PD653]